MELRVLFRSAGLLSAGGAFGLLRFRLFLLPGFPECATLSGFNSASFFVRAYATLRMYAIAALMAGVNPAYVAKQLGHTNAEVGARRHYNQKIAFLKF